MGSSLSLAQSVECTLVPYPSTLRKSQSLSLSLSLDLGLSLSQNLSLSLSMRLGLRLSLSLHQPRAPAMAAPGGREVVASCAAPKGVRAALALALAQVWLASKS